MLGPRPGSIEPSYAALLRVPGFGRVVLGTLLARLCGAMWEIVLVLFVLQRYQSPSLAGLTVLLSILPGLAFSPVAGALLDRQGRVRLMILDCHAPSPPAPHCRPTSPREEATSGQTGKTPCLRSTRGCWLVA